ncbi:MAG: VWA domain-containing protein, partial [Pseudomonadota bacterium]|nr:VWA domain-containing protein [Pseudomonadota bacterium]
MTDNERTPYQNIGQGKLAENILHFARLLRSAGLPIGPGSVIDAIAAVNKIELSQRSDFYWCLNAVFVNRHDQMEVFNQAFHIFWRNPKFLERMLSLALPSADDAVDEAEAILPRLAEAFPDYHHLNEQLDAHESEKQFDSVMTWSQNEMLRELDFEKMTKAEMEEAKKIMKKLTLPL